VWRMSKSKAKHGKGEVGDKYTDYDTLEEDILADDDGDDDDNYDADSKKRGQRQEEEKKSASVLFDFRKYVG
jgi:hypothetical protein